jgi:Xaa-Pro aminopeptidase
MSSSIKNTEASLKVTSIVGAGNNGCCITLKTAKQKSKNELVLMDLGAEYHGYNVDVTRTILQTVNFPQSKKLI